VLLVPPHRFPRKTFAALYIELFRVVPTHHIFRRVLQPPCSLFAPCLKGIEGIFKTVGRLKTKGTENHVVSVPRVYNTAAAAARDAFPGVMQQVITQQDCAACFGRGRWDEVRAHVATLGRDKRSLSTAAFRLPGTAPDWLTKPSPEDPTMAAVAHSQQVAFEECLLACKVRNGCFVRIEPLTRSWTCSLVHTITMVAQDLYEPSILADVSQGQTYLIFLGSGRCLWGWPLTVLDSDRCILGLGKLTMMVPVIVIDPCLAFLS